MTLSVDPVALDGAGVALGDVGKDIGLTLSTLTGTLSGCGSMCGNDPVGESVGRAYDRSAQALLDAMVASRNGLVNLGDGVRMSAHNYSSAEAHSDMSRRAQALPVPVSSGRITAPSAPSSVGAGDDAPAGWGWVAKYIGMIWPNGDPGKLAAAAGAWIAAGSELVATEVAAAAPLGVVGGQQIPEGEAIGSAFAASLRSASAVMSQCTLVASQLISYAAKIEAVHAAILDLLSRICDPMTGFKVVWEFLTDADEDEIEQIAHDIKTVIDNFTSEVSALESQIAVAAQEAATIVSTMAPYADKVWDEFLHGTDVGRALNQVSQTVKGAGLEVWDMGEGVVTYAWKHNVVRLVVDPVGYYNDGKEELKAAAPFVGLGDDGAPGVVESWKALGKDITHWDMWSTNPAEALGRTVIDIGSMLVPGGASGKLTKITDMLEGLTAARRTTELTSQVPRAISDMPKPLEVPAKPGDPPKPSELPKPSAEVPPPAASKPATDVPAGPRSAEPTSAPADRPLPSSLTETREPGEPARPAPADAPSGSPTGDRAPSGQGTDHGQLTPVASAAADSADASKRFVPPNLAAELPQPVGHTAPSMADGLSATGQHTPSAAGGGAGEPGRPLGELPSATGKADDRVLASVGSNDAERAAGGTGGGGGGGGGEHRGHGTHGNGEVPVGPEPGAPVGDHPTDHGPSSAASPGNHESMEHAAPNEAPHDTDPADAGWQNDNGASLTPSQNEAADAFLQQAKDAEPHITESMEKITGKLDDGELVGIDHRLKTEESLKEKLSSLLDTRQDLSVDEHLARLQDSVRYTIQSEYSNYVSDVGQAINELVQEGYECTKFKNTWEQDGYQGINSFWRDPASGHTFEVQFHTPDSFDTKMATHELYEEQRSPDISDERWAELEAQQDEMFREIPRPPGAPEINPPNNEE